MAKKFFYNRVYNTKRTIINLIIIGVCVIGVIICFVVTSNFQGENKNTPEGILSIKSEVAIEVNESYTNEIFFSKIENIDLDKIEVIYPDDFEVSKLGEYEITIKVNNKNYNTILKIIDTTQPELLVKEVTITKGGSYTVNSFVDSCSDNSGKDCLISFYQGIDEDGNATEYSNYKEVGTYAIKVSATDESGNQTIQETKLNIVKSDETPSPKPPVTSTCKYGNNEYDTTNYLVASDITTNKCAVSLDLYKDSSTTKEINKLMENETIKIKKDVDALNLKGTLALNRKVTAVINNSGNGIVGYELRMTVTITNNGKSTTVADYKVNSSGKRVFITNPHELAN